MRAADEEEIERTAVHADGHAQRDLAGFGREGTDPPQRGAHLERRGRRPAFVAGSVEEQHQRVAAELQQRRAVVVRVGEELAEA